MLVLMLKYIRSSNSKPTKMKKNVIEKTGIVGISVEFSCDELTLLKELQEKFVKRISDSTDLEVLALLAKITEGFKAPENVHQNLFGVISAFTPKEQAMCRNSVISKASFERELENAEKTLIQLEENNGITFVHLSYKGEDVYRTVLPSSSPIKLPR